jgi:hypothetical protein
MGMLVLLPREEGGGGGVLLPLAAQLVRMIQETRSCFVLVVCNDDDIYSACKDGI